MKRDWALFFWMLGVSVAHGLRFLLFDDPLNRQVVAAGGVLIYALTGLLALVPQEAVHGNASNPFMVTGYTARWPQKLSWVSTSLFPLVGLTLVLVTGAEVDNWQLAVGVTQFAAIPYVLLRWQWERG